MAHPKPHAVRITQALTRQERMVLVLVAEGLTNQQIADHLCVSKRTADFHLASICRKLEVRTRLQAVLIAERKGLLDIRDK